MASTKARATVGQPVRVDVWRVGDGMEEKANTRRDATQTRRQEGSEHTLTSEQETVAHASDAVRSFKSPLVQEKS